MSEKELQGLKYGLHREGFNPKNQVKNMQLLVGMEVDHALSIGFDLLAHLQGINSQNLVKHEHKTITNSHYLAHE